MLLLTHHHTIIPRRLEVGFGIKGSVQLKLAFNMFQIVFSLLSLMTTGHITSRIIPGTRKALQPPELTRLRAMQINNMPFQNSVKYLRVRLVQILAYR